LKHIVFVMGSYYPRFSAVGACGHRVITALKGEFKISVIAMADEHAEELRANVDGVDIYRVVTPDIATRARLARNLQNHSNAKDRLHLLALRGRSTLRRLLSPATIDHALVDAYLHQLRQIRDFDVIVPLVFPFESVIAALEYASSSDVMVIPYLFDNFVESRSLHVLAIARKLKERRHVRLEKDMLERSDAVLSMHPLETHFRKHFGSIVDRKIRFLEHPLLSKKERLAGPANATVRMVYTGALIRNIHEPSYVMDLIDTLDLGMPFEVDFYVMGNGASQVKSKTTLFGVHVRNCGRVSKQEADVAVAQSTVLLNIGEIEGRQISSKVFEYMAAGKPIIHFAHSQDDAVARILDRYPLALCLLQKQHLMDENREQFKRFVIANAGKSMDFEDVAEIFPEALPETTARAFVDAITRRRDGIVTMATTFRV